MKNEKNKVKVVFFLFPLLNFTPPQSLSHPYSRQFFGDDPMKSLNFYMLDNPYVGPYNPGDLNSLHNLSIR